jgi:hypothetical protein
MMVRHVGCRARARSPFISRRQLSRPRPSLRTQANLTRRATNSRRCRQSPTTPPRSKR